MATASIDKELAALKDLLLWARKEKIALQQAIIGTSSVVVSQDMKLIEPTLPSQQRHSEGKKGIYEEYAGQALEVAEEQEQQGIEPTEEDD